MGWVVKNLKTKLIKNKMKNNELTFVANKATIRLYNLLFSRTTWKLMFVGAFIGLSFASYHMFVTNYRLQKPWTSKHTESWQDIAERAEGNLSACQLTAK